MTLKIYTIGSLKENSPPGIRVTRKEMEKITHIFGETFKED